MDTKLMLFLIMQGIFAIVLAYPECMTDDVKPHDAQFGAVVAGDRLLYETHERMQGQMLLPNFGYVVWPPKGEDVLATITRVEVYDQMTDGTGGCAFLVQGGAGTNHVKLLLKTKYNAKYDFYIKVYGR